MSDESAPPAAALGQELGLREGAVRVAIHRLRQRFAECLRSEVRHTLGNTGDLEEEIRELFRALS